jgi:hypothetical protein
MALSVIDDVAMFAAVHLLSAWLLAHIHRAKAAI